MPLHEFFIMPRFFMSYPRENKSIAVGLMSGLKSLNFDVWMDQAMAPKEDWVIGFQKKLKGRLQIADAG